MGDGGSGVSGRRSTLARRPAQAGQGTRRAGQGSGDRLLTAGPTASRQPGRHLRPLSSAAAPSPGRCCLAVAAITDLRLVLERCCAGGVLALFGEADDNLAHEHDRHGGHHGERANAAGQADSEGERYGERGPGQTLA
jgi:hypothetical protein